jgi:hypothetical protein
VKIAERDGKLVIERWWLGMKELSLGGDRVPDELRWINSSSKEHDVYKLPYPGEPGLERNPANLVKPLNPPADWNTKVKATGETMP